jgi:hypothetical protein
MDAMTAGLILTTMIIMVGGILAYVYLYGKEVNANNVDTSEDTSEDTMAVGEKYKVKLFFKLEHSSKYTGIYKVFTDYHSVDGYSIDAESRARSYASSVLSGKAGASLKNSYYPASLFSVATVEKV